MKSFLVVVVLTLVGLAGCAVPPPAGSEKASSAAPSPVPVSSPSPAPGAIVYRGGDGSSIEQAIVIVGAPNESAGVRAESAWVRKHHPGWRKGMQALLSQNGKQYDRIEYTTPDGRTQTLYFDITDFFGKW